MPSPPAPLSQLALPASCLRLWQLEYQRSNDVFQPCLKTGRKPRLLSLPSYLKSISHPHDLSSFLITPSHDLNPPNQLNTKHTSKHSTSNQSSCLTQRKHTSPSSQLDSAAYPLSVPGLRADILPDARDSASRHRRSSLLKARSPPDKSSVRTSLVLEIRLLPQSSQVS